MLGTRVGVGVGLGQQLASAPRQENALITFSSLSRSARVSLTFIRTCDMVFHMKTTLNISDVTMRALKREAARRRQSMSELVETALRMLLETRRKPPSMQELPSFDGGGLLTDISDRDALYHAMEGH